MKKRRWLKMQKKTEPDLPLKPPIPFLESYSNGEFFYEQTPRDRMITKLILEKAEASARKLGVIKSKCSEEPAHDQPLQPDAERLRFRRSSKNSTATRSSRTKSAPRSSA